MRVLRWLMVVPVAVLASMLGSLVGGIAFTIFGSQSLMDAGSAFVGSLVLVFVAGLIAPSRRTKTALVFLCIIVVLALLSFVLSVATNIEEFADRPALDKLLIPLAQILGGFCAIFLFLFTIMPGAALKESWVATVPALAFGSVFFIVAYIGGLALHVWTCFLFYHQWNPFWGVAAFFAPFLAEAVAVYACFGWHIWYYILAIALWLVACAPASFMEENAMPRRVLSFLFSGWICVVCILSVSFGHYAWRYSLGPTSRTVSDQRQLEDCAVAVIACLRASASDDPGDLASLVKAKKELKDTIRGYDKASLDDLCSIVDQFLLFERSLQDDLLAYMEELRRNGGTSKFKIGDGTRQALDRLPNKVRTGQDTNGMEAAMAQITKQGNPSNLPENWREILDNRAARSWTIYGQTYSELLGRAMPRPAD